MPKSRVRKKKGKRVTSHGARLKVDPNKESNISMQDLINVLAYKEFKDGNYSPPEAAHVGNVGEIYSKIRVNGEDYRIAEGVIVRGDAIVNIPESMEVFIEDDRGNKIGVGTAARIEGDDEHVSITITDPDVLEMIQAPVGAFSIAEDPSKENTE